MSKRLVDVQHQTAGMSVFDTCTFLVHSHSTENPRIRIICLHNGQLFKDDRYNGKLLKYDRYNGQLFKYERFNGQLFKFDRYKGKLFMYDSYNGKLFKYDRYKLL